MPLTDAQTIALTDAVRAVSATEIVPRFRALDPEDIDEKSSFDDLVTIADRAAEAALTQRVRGILPGDGVVGEEAVSTDASLLDRVGHGRVTIIDPIDGTWNFAHGNANFGVILAVLEEGEAVWGMLYDPSFDDWVEATRGGGASFVRGGTRRRLTLDQADTPLSRLRGNISYDGHSPASQAALAATSHLVRRASSLGASVHEYRMQAQGHRDFCLNGFLKVWDHAAGVLALREAGGIARLLDGREYAPTMRDGILLTARTERMWDALADTFNDALVPVAD